MAVRLLSELDDFEKLALIDMSYSRLDTYAGGLGCPAKYFYTYIAKEPRLFGAPATLGNIIHSTLEECIEAEVCFDLDQLLGSFKIWQKHWDPTGLIPPELIEAGVEMLTEFVDRHLEETFPVIAKELPFQIVVGTALISGFIDRVDIDGDLIRITDYKTGKKEVAAKNAYKDLQLGIYALALDKLYPNKKIYAQLYYLRTGRQKGHLFTRDDLDAIEYRLTELISEIIETKNFRYTGNEFTCNWCDHSISGACPVGSRRIQNRK